MYRLKTLLAKLAAGTVFVLTTPMAMADVGADEVEMKPRVAVEQPVAGSPLGGAVLDPDALDGQRGGADKGDQFISIADLKSQVAGNSVENVVTGGNLIKDSFGQSNWAGSIIQNSGNATAIQTSTILQVIIQ